MSLLPSGTVSLHFCLQELLRIDTTMQLGQEMKWLTDCGAVSHGDVCKFLFALSSFVEETANSYFKDNVHGRGRGSAMC